MAMPPRHPLAREALTLASDPSRPSPRGRCDAHRHAGENLHLGRLLTTTSREIYGLTGELHQDVLRAIRVMQAELEISASSLEGGDTDGARPTPPTLIRPSVRRCCWCRAKTWR